MAFGLLMISGYTDCSLAQGRAPRGRDPRPAQRPSVPIKLLVPALRRNRDGPCPNRLAKKPAIPRIENPVPPDGGDGGTSSRSEHRRVALNLRSVDLTDAVCGHKTILPRFVRLSNEAPIAQPFESG
jgi:hypothetical protein